MLIQKCPICGGALQGTKTIYLQNVRISETGEYILGERGALGQVVSIYCENDHTETEIKEALQSQDKAAREEEPACPK
ncbi:MAG TPA: hypothetical protein VGB77_15745 [Abditibacteriaceae bacterium]|jgi:hypothetical protein